jgi:hypothetical protein
MDNIYVHRPKRIPAELEELYMNDPLVHAALAPYVHGEETREQALIRAVIALAAANEDKLHILRQYAERTVVPFEEFR